MKKTTLIYFIIVYFSVSAILTAYPSAVRINPAQNPEQTTWPGMTSPNLFSGFAAKVGGLISPDPGGLDKAWILGFNYDISFRRNFALSIEILPTYRSYSEIDLRILPILGFLNFKAGMNMEDIVSSWGFMSPFAGVGTGLEAVYSSVKLDGDNYTDFSIRFAYHFFMGLQLELGSLLLIGEYQLVRVPDPNVDPGFWRHYFLIGINFKR